MKKMLIVAVALLGLVLSGAPAQAEVDAAKTKPIVGTFVVADRETMRVKFTKPSEIARAYDVLAGKDRAHPIGLIVYGDPEVNIDWSWHLADTVWSEVSIEVCDGIPSDVEKHQITSDYFCPWTARLVRIEQAR